MDTILMQDSDSQKNATVQARAWSRSPRGRRRKRELADLGVIASRLVHEIRNPLNTMRVQAAVIARKVSRGEPADIEVAGQQLTALECEIVRLEKLAQAFLSYGRPPDGEPGAICLPEFLTKLKLLIEAAQETELVEPFAQIRELADHAVTYRVAGLLTEVKQLLTVRSRLHAAVPDALHRGGIEIVSRSSMNTRAIPESRRFVPVVLPAKPSCAKAANGTAPEEIVFDKADKAETLERLREQYRKLEAEIETATANQRQANDDSEKK